MSEVSVDTLTGEYTVDKVNVLHDVGNSLNPAIDIGQIEGAFIQGMGWLTTEDLKWNEAGKLISENMATYKIPAIGDTPKEFNVKLFGRKTLKTASTTQKRLASHHLCWLFQCGAPLKTPYLAYLATRLIRN